MNPRLLLLTLSTLALSSCAHNHLQLAPQYTAPPNTGQLDLSCSPQSDLTVRKMFDRAVAHQISVILCAIDNNSQEQVSFSQTRLYRSLSYLHPIASSAMALEVSEADKNNIIARLERVGGNIVPIINVAIEDKSLTVPIGVATAAGLVMAEAPNLLKWLGLIAPTVSANYQTVNQVAPANIPPGGSALIYVFTEKWDWTGAKPIQFSIPVDSSPKVRLMQ